MTWRVLGPSPYREGRRGRRRKAEGKEQEKRVEWKEKSRREGHTHDDV